MSQSFKILSFTLFITAVFLGCTTQSDSYNCSLNIDSDLSKENIKGNVKEIETLIYRGEIDEKVTLSINPGIINIIQYDNCGNRKEIERSGVIKGTTTYKYYSNGYLKRLTEYQGGKIVYEETHKYEDSNFVRISQYYSDSEISNGTEISYFDTSRKIIKREHYNTLDKIESHKEFSYEQGTEQDKNITLSYSFNTLIETLTEKLNSNKQIIFSEYKFKNNSLNYSRTNEYDKFGNLILSKIEYPEHSNENRIESFKYEYDSQGNWIKRINFSNDKLTNIIIRKIKYY